MIKKRPFAFLSSLLFFLSLSPIGFADSFPLEDEIILSERQMSLLEGLLLGSYYVSDSSPKARFGLGGLFDTASIMTEEDFLGIFTRTSRLAFESGKEEYALNISENIQLHFYYAPKKFTCGPLVGGTFSIKGEASLGPSLFKQDDKWTDYYQAYSQLSAGVGIHCQLNHFVTLSAIAEVSPYLYLNLDNGNQLNSLGLSGRAKTLFMIQNIFFLEVLAERNLMRQGSPLTRYQGTLRVTPGAESFYLYNSATHIDFQVSQRQEFVLGFGLSF
jgi:hypothetical protein